MRRCLFRHKWGAGKVVTATSDVRYARAVPHYRTCKRCGTMQRGIYDRVWNCIAWETMREREFIKSEQIRIVRKPSSRLEQLAHSLGLRRSRMSDETRSGKRSALTQS